MTGATSGRRTRRVARRVRSAGRSAASRCPPWRRGRAASSDCSPADGAWWPGLGLPSPRPAAAASAAASALGRRIAGPCRPTHELQADPSGAAVRARRTSPETLRSSAAGCRPRLVRGPAGGDAGGRGAARPRCVVAAWRAADAPADPLVAAAGAGVGELDVEVYGIPEPRVRRFPRPDDAGERPAARVGWRVTGPSSGRGRRERWRSTPGGRARRWGGVGVRDARLASSRCPVGCPPRDPRRRLGRAGPVAQPADRARRRRRGGRPPRSESGTTCRVSRARSAATPPGCCPAWSSGTPRASPLSSTATPRRRVSPTCWRCPARTSRSSAARW